MTYYTCPNCAVAMHWTMGQYINQCAKCGHHCMEVNDLMRKYGDRPKPGNYFATHKSGYRQILQVAPAGGTYIAGPYTGQLVLEIWHFGKEESSADFDDYSEWTEINDARKV